MRFDSIVNSVAPTSRNKRRYITAAIAGAAFISAAATQSALAGTYNYVFAGTNVDWTNVPSWTLASGTASATNYPGGDPTEVDDVSMVYTGTPAGGGLVAVGVNNITLSSPLNNSIGNLTMTLTDGTTTDQLNLALNANLTINGSATLTAGSGTSGISKGLVTLTTGNLTTFTVGGTLTLAGANGNGTANTFGYDFVTINGNASLGGLSIKDDADKVVVSAGAGNVNLGNVSLGRTLANATAASAGGLHLLGGNVTANNFLIGSADSSADVEVNGANLTITGSFIVGDNSAASPRLSSVFQTLGNVNASNSTLFLGSSAVGTVGVYVLSNNSLSVAGIQLTNVGGSANNKANFTMASGTVLNVGTAGIGTGSGTYTFTNNGGTIIATGSFTSAANMAITNNATFQAADSLNNPFNITWNGAISGAGTITKSGGGNLTLSGANTYTGTTTINAGTLIVSNTASGSSGTGTGAVAINSASLAGTGTLAGDVTVSSGSHIAPGVNSVGTLNFGGNLTISSGSILDFDFNISANSFINFTNAAKTLSLGTLGIDLYAEGTTNAWQTNGTYNLIQVAGSVPSIAGLSILNGMPGVTYTLGTSAHDVTVTISGGLGATGWAHDISGSWGASGNWNGGIPGGNVAILGNVLTAARTVTLDGDRSVTGINLNSPFGYTIAQGSGGNLTLDNGASTATINDFAGPHVISAPVIFNSSTVLATTNPTDTLTLSGVVGGVGSMAVSGPGTVILTNTANTFSGGINNTGNLQVGSGAAIGSLGTGTVVNTGVLNFNSSSNMTIATVISGSGNVVQNGTGVLTLSGINTYSGTTVINNGIVRFGTTTGLSSDNVNVVTPGKLDLNGLAVTMTTLTGNGTVDNLLTGSNATLTFNGASPTFNGSIQSSVGNLAVVSSVSGRLTLGGTSTYTGGTSVTTGTIGVNSNGALGTGTLTMTSTAANTLVLGAGVVLPNTISLNDGSIEFADLATGGTSATLAGPISTVGSTQYRLGNSNTTSTLIMTGASTVGTGITLFTRGNIVFAGNGSLIVSNNSISVGRSGATAVVTLTVQDNAVLRGVGINLGGLNSTSDDLTSNITLNGNGTMDAGTGVFSLNDNDVGNSSAPSAITLTTNDNSTVRGSAFTMTGSSTHTSTFWLAAGGNIVASANNANFMPNSSALTFDLAGTVNINDGGFNIGIAQNIGDFGGGAINKTGTGALTLSGNNAYGSGTTVSAGTLYANGTSALGTGAVTVSSGATLGGIGTISNSVAVSGHLAPGNGATTGTLVLSGVTLSNGSTLDINIGSTGTASLLELASGSLTNNGAGLDLYQAGTALPFDVNGTYPLIKFDGGFVDPGFTSVLNAVSGATYIFSHDASTLSVTISGGLTNAAWAVDANGSWSTTGSWTGGIPNQVGAVANFASIITAPRSVTLDGTKTVGVINFSNANAYAINPGTGGSLVLDNGAATPQINDSTGSHSINVPVTINSNTTATVTNATDTLTLSGAISGTGLLTFQGAGKLALSGANSFAGLTAAGTGTVILAGANTYSGATTITSGSIQLGAGGTLGNGLSPLSIASGSTLDMNGQNATVGSLTGAGTIDNVAGAGASTLTTGGLNVTATFSGVIKNTTGTVGLTKVGTGNLTLSGTNTFTGNVTLTGGELAVSATANLGAANNTINFNGGVLQVTGTTLTAPGRTVAWSPAGGGFDITSSTNTFTVSTALSGGGLIKRGPGALVVSAAYNTTSPTTLTAGNLTLSAAGNTSGAVAGAGNLTVSAGTKAAPGLIAGGIQVNALVISGAVQIAPASSTSVLSSYTLAGATGAWTASFDLNGNKLVVEDAVTKATTVATLQNQVAFGAANAFGISSTGLPSNYGIAVIDNGALQVPKTTFGTASVDANSVLVAPEILGDSNADGHVDLTDLSTVLNNFGSTTSAWTSGNFDGAATIDLTDLSDVLNNFGLSNPNAASETLGSSPAAATPEPASLAILSLGGALLLRRRPTKFSA